MIQKIKEQKRKKKRYKDRYVAAFIRWAQVLATLLHISPGGTETLAPSPPSVRKTMSPSNMRFSSVPLRPSLASPIPQVWITLALKLPCGSRFPFIEGWLIISTLLMRASLQPCCVFASVLLLLSSDRTPIALKHLKTP